MPITHYGPAGLTLYARVADGSDTSVALTAGSGVNTGVYTATDAALVTAGLAAGNWPFGVYAGAVGSQSASDVLHGGGQIAFDGTVETSADELISSGAFTVAAQANSGSAATASISAIEVAKEYTFCADSSGRRSRNIVEVNTNHDGTFAIEPALNRWGDLDINATHTVTVTGPDTVTTSNISVSGDGKQIHFDTTALTTAGTYTVTATVVTLDSVTLVITGTLIVY